KTIIICAIIAVAIAVILTVVFKLTSNNEEGGKTDSSSSAASVSALSESTKSYTSEELSAIAEWWETVSVTNEAE
ncbi:MAG: hypothetical protein KBS52_00820, partial [Clostridiales bacterium]|nr:hypothetical protein [Candidatus Equinaster intestinalis]